MKYPIDRFSIDTKRQLDLIDKTLAKRTYISYESYNLYVPYDICIIVHYYTNNQEPMKYPIDRFTIETKRQLDLLDKTLAERPYIAGDTYTIADIAIWSWYGRLVLGDLYEGSAEFLNVDEYTHLLEWANRIAERPGVQKGLDVEYQSIEE